MDKYLNRVSRLRILTLCLLIAIATLVVRLFQIQILMHAKYTEMAYKEQVKKLVIPAKRGLIYTLDNGRPSPIVLNTTVYKMFIDPMVVKDEPGIKAALYEEARANIYQEDKLNDKFTNKKSRYQVVAINLSRQQAEKIKAKKLFGVGFQALSKRVYPESELAAQLLGFVNAEGGQYGVEGALNHRLAGQDGVLESVTDIAQVPLTIGEQNTHRAAVDGDNLVLTIDKNIQAQVEKSIFAAADKIGADNISVLVLNPKNSQILAMASYPTFDPSNYASTKDIKLFNNPVTMLLYEPGSVMKTFTLAMALNENIVQPQSYFYNTDLVRVADRTIVNAIKGKTGWITMQTAMNYSLNTGMVEILARAGGGQINSKSNRLLYSYLHDRFRLGLRTGVEIPDAPGLIISPDQQEGNAVRYSNMTFGQGLNLTMLQVANAYAALVNGGNFYQPTIIAGLIQPNGEFMPAEPRVSSGQIIKSQTSQSMRQVLQEVRRVDRTGRFDRIGFNIGGKTGTSETLDAQGKYTKTQTIASYLGHGGGRQAEYVIMVQVGAKGRYLTGGAHAAPIFGEISNWLLTYLKIQPKE